MKKGDVILILLALLAAFGVAMFLNIHRGESAELVQISIEGNMYGSYHLYENQEITIENEYGKNVIIIEDGKVKMKEADCPDKYCVSHRAISKAKETIVCLPHKLVVEIKTSVSNQNIDAVVS